MKQRDDIDGLRAVAILPVVFFHYNFLKSMPGGFVGVDIFFVISGYLITRIIYDGIANNTYSISEFYYRRVRRIFPALFTVFACCLICSFFISFPNDAHDVGTSVLAATFFVSNILFYLSSGYFDQASEINPLLHTWSLSVEEQFYVLFPLLVFAIRKYSNQTRIRILFALTILSFIYASLMLPIDKSAVFYLVQYRAWELLTGALIALGGIPNVNQRWAAEVLGALGLVLIAVSITMFSSTTPFPGYSALLPCLGAALIIHSGTAANTWTSRLLSIYPLRFIGLVSYSFYLWHWPILVFYRYFFLKDPTGLVERGSLIGLTFVLAVLSWHFIEKPFRGKRTREEVKGSKGVKATLSLAGASMLVISLFALLLGPTNAQFWKFPDRVTETMAFVNYESTRMMRTGECFMSTSANDFDNFKKDTCLIIKPGKQNFLIFGDSHAAHLWYGLAQTYPDVNFLQATSSGCKPIMHNKTDRTCSNLVKYIAEDFVPHSHLDAIILSANWNDGDAENLKKTVETLRQYTGRIIIFGPIVEYDQPLPRVLARSIYLNDPEIIKRHRMPEKEKTDQLFADVFRESGAQYVSVYDTLCVPDCTTWVSTSTPLQYDYGHLTRAGSVFLASHLRTQLFSR